MAQNPSLRLPSELRRAPGRSSVEHEARRLVDLIGVQRQFSLDEVASILATAGRSTPPTPHLLVGPAAALHLIPPGRGVKAISDHLRAALRRTRKEAIVMTPFWAPDALEDILRAPPGSRGTASLVLLLGQTGGQVGALENLVVRMRAAWGPGRLRIFIHRLNGHRPESYPHAKCVVVDRREGYLGSANLTGPGMEGHLELGTTLAPADAETLAGFLEQLWGERDTFELAWDSGPN
jgi:hypothetical protein